MRSLASYLPVKCSDLHIELSSGQTMITKQCIETTMYSERMYRLNNVSRAETKSVLSANKSHLSAEQYADVGLAYQVVLN